MRLRYTGQAPTAFVALGAELFPGDTFTVPDDQAGAWLARPDIEAADPAPSPAPRARKKTAPPTAPAGDAPAATASPEEGDDAVPDSDH